MTGTARPLHVGRSTQVWEIRIEDEAGRGRGHLGTWGETPDMPPAGTSRAAGKGVRIFDRPQRWDRAVPLIVSPPESFIIDGSWSVRSGLIFDQRRPPSIVRNRNWFPK